jgi:ELWxxDGT repeat protein
LINVLFMSFGTLHAFLTRSSYHVIINQAMRCIVLLLVFLLFCGSAFSQAVISASPVESDEYFSRLMAVNDKLYFVVQYSNDPDAGAALWKTDVNRTDAVLIKNFRKINSLTNYRGTLFFVADDDVSGDELWKSNGTPEGTTRVKDINPGIAGSTLSGFSISNGILYFTAVDGVHGRELWKTNGMTAGTGLVKDIMRVVGSSNPRALVDVNGTLFFSANDGIIGYELWRTDGTTTGTHLVKDLTPGYKVSSAPASLINKNGILIFTAVNAITGRELWRSDGSQAGTFLIKDIRPGTVSSNASQLTLVDSTIYFSADDGQHGLELWKSDGTTAGTNLFVDLTPGPGSNTAYTTPHLVELTSVNHKLYFLAVTPGPSFYEFSQSLWVSDGTEAGTRRLTLFSDASFSFIIAYITEFKSAAFFVAATEGEHLDLWRSNGTVRNTTPVITDVAERYSYLVRLTRVGNYLYYIGHENLNRTDGTAAGTITITGIEPTPEREVTIAHAKFMEEQQSLKVATFPAPFDLQFNLKVTGSNRTFYNVRINDLYGAEIRSSQLSTNVNYSLGEHWPPGFYVMTIAIGDTTITRRIFKNR